MKRPVQRLLGRIVVILLVGPHAVSCATTSTRTWEVRRTANSLLPEELIQRTCGGRAPCAALCEELKSNWADEPWSAACESSWVADCQARGGDLLITCETEDTRKGCMPDS